MTALAVLESVRSNTSWIEMSTPSQFPERRMGLVASYAPYLGDDPILPSVEFSQVEADIEY